MGQEGCSYRSIRPYFGLCLCPFLQWLAIASEKKIFVKNSKFSLLSSSLSACSGLQPQERQSDSLGSFKLKSNFISNLFLML